MKLLQIKGPFAANSYKEFRENDVNYVHIGIQIPNRQPISWWSEEKQKYISFDGPPTADIEINGQGYRINERGILEFDGQLSDGYVKIQFKKNFPMETIVDIIYSEGIE